jgi:hypothetical protein
MFGLVVCLNNFHQNYKNFEEVVKDLSLQYALEGHDKHGDYYGYSGYNTLEACLKAAHNIKCVANKYIKIFYVCVFEDTYAFFGPDMNESKILFKSSI